VKKEILVARQAYHLRFAIVDANEQVSVDGIDEIPHDAPKNANNDGHGCCALISKIWRNRTDETQACRVVAGHSCGIVQRGRTNCEMAR
jgi:hypothetical protein